MNNSAVQERKTFIVQNITLNYHCVSDIGLNFSPREVKDLTWEDDIIIRKSMNLKESLRNGILKELSQEEYDKTMEMQYQKEKKQLLRDQQNKKTEYEKIKIDDKDVMADTFDLNKSKRKTGELDLTGNANHPMSYVAAYEIASNIANDRGDVLTAEEFADLVEENPRIVESLLSQTKSASVEKNHKVFYAIPTGDNANSIGVVQGKMTNYNRDAKYAGLEHNDNVAVTSYIKDAVDFNVSDNDTEFAEEINLEND